MVDGGIAQLSATSESTTGGDWTFVCPDCGVVFTIDTLDSEHTDTMTIFCDPDLAEIEEVIVPRRCYRDLSLARLIALWE